MDVKADQKNKTLKVLSCRYESSAQAKPSSAKETAAVRYELQRFAGQLSLKLSGWQ
jgi:hypothetical protein